MFLGICSETLCGTFLDLGLDWGVLKEPGLLPTALGRSSDCLDCAAEGGVWSSDLPPMAVVVTVAADPGLDNWAGPPTAPINGAPYDCLGTTGNLLSPASCTGVWLGVVTMVTGTGDWGSPDNNPGFSTDTSDPGLETIGTEGDPDVNCVNPEALSDCDSRWLMVCIREAGGVTLASFGVTLVIVGIICVTVSGTCLWVGVRSVALGVNCVPTDVNCVSVGVSSGLVGVKCVTKDCIISGVNWVTEDSVGVLCVIAGVNCVSCALVGVSCATVGVSCVTVGVHCVNVGVNCVTGD